MAINIGYLTARTTRESDELFTPKYGVEPILKYIPQHSTIWCPFDTAQSAYVDMLTREGHEVIHSHIDEGKDFFAYEPESYDIIVSNPPFSLKDKVLERLYSLNKPFAILLPMNSLQGKSRYQYFSQGIQLLAFDQRIGFHDINHLDTTVEGVPFASAYFCRNLLPNDLILEHIEKY